MRMFKRKPKKSHSRVLRTPDTSQTNNKVFSYRSSRNNVELSTDRKVQSGARESRKIHRMNKFIVLISLFAIVGCVFYVSTLEPNAKVITLSSSNSAQSLLRDVKVYQKGADEILSNSIFNRSKLTINAKSIEFAMKQQFPELQDVAITIPIMGHKPVFQVSSSVPIFIISSNKGSFVVDKRGRVTMRVEDVKNLSSFKPPTVVDQSGIDIEPGTSVLTINDAEFISTVVSQLKAKNISIQSITLPPLANEMHIKIEGKPYTVKFNLSDDAMQQIGAFLSVKQKLEAEGKIPSQYIDLRVEEKVYYK